MNQRVISVQGRGTATAEPDLVQLSFNISVMDQEYDGAIAGLNDRVNQLRQDVAIVDVDPKGLKTTSFNISPKHRWNEERDEHIFLGFEAKHDLRLELPLDQDLLNRTLAQLAQSASQATFSIYFAVKDGNALRQRVLADAVARARENAETLAQAARGRGHAGRARPSDAAPPPGRVRPAGRAARNGRRCRATRPG